MAITEKSEPQDIEKLAPYLSSLEIESMNIDMGILTFSDGSYMVLDSFIYVPAADIVADLEGQIAGIDAARASLVAQLEGAKAKLSKE